jgi:hypothetical protein
MPAMIACPNSQCQFPGPLGFNDPAPWGIHFYHSGCPGAWLFNEVWYDTQAEAWEAYKKQHGPFDPDWVAAFDAKILRNDHEEYERLIQVWREHA